MTKFEIARNWRNYNVYGASGIKKRNILGDLGYLYYLLCLILVFYLCIKTIGYFYIDLNFIYKAIVSFIIVKIIDTFTHWADWVGEILCKGLGLICGGYVIVYCQSAFNENLKELLLYYVISFGICYLLISSYWMTEKWLSNMPTWKICRDFGKKCQEGRENKLLVHYQEVNKKKEESKNKIYY